MARCTGSSACNCVLAAGSNTSVDGAGTSSAPYQVNATRQGLLVTTDSPTVELTLTGDGVKNPYLLTADAHLSLSELDNVSGNVPQVGQVLAWNGSTWLPVPPATTQPGLVNVAGCVAGDGAVATPLRLLIDSAGGLSCGTAGLGLTADYHANLRVNSQMSYASSDQVLDASRANFLSMPTGQHVYTAPAWAKSVVIDYQIEMLYATNGPWAGSVGRCVVRRDSGDTVNPLFESMSSTKGIPMMSQRVSGPRGSSVGYREARKLTDVTGGEEIRLYSQMRATGISGGGDTRSDSTLTVMMSQMTWSDQ